MLDTIKSDLNQARKDRNTVKANVLSSVVGELQRGATKEVAGSQVISLMRKMLVTAQENKKQFPDRAEIQQEIDILNSYLPQMMDEPTLRKTMEELRDQGIDDIGPMMKALQSQYTGLYDGRLAASIAKEMLS